MRTDFAFAEILESISNETYANQSFQGTDFMDSALSHQAPMAEWETILEPAGMSYLIGRTSVYKTTSVSKYKSNFQRPAFQFSNEQLEAFNILTSWAAELKNNFTLKQLKSAYRQALLKTHPDQGGNSENFWDVKKSYEVLLTLVTK